MSVEALAAVPFTLFVHIGDGKTGTSAIQKMLRSEAGMLSEENVEYLGLMLEFAELKKYEWQRDTRIEAFHALPRERASAEMAEVLEGSIALARQRGRRALVLSNETLLGRNGAAIDALGRVQASGVEIHPIVYVRRHDAWARSAYAQWGLRHKTYDGPIKSFEEWRETRRFALYPKLQPWLDAFGNAVSVRNFDAISDVAADFLEIIGVDSTRSIGVRANETPLPEELALRALFNHQQPTPSAPVRFNKLLGSADVDFRISLGHWLSEKLPTSGQLRDISLAYEQDRNSINTALEACGQPPLSTSALVHEGIELDQEVLVSALFQLIVRQAQRLEAVEQRLAKMAVASPVGEARSAPQADKKPLAHTDWDVPADAGAGQILAPALGYFGANPTDRLEVDVKGSIRELHLSLGEPTRTFLNLSRLDLLRAGSVLELKPSSISARQSSVGGDKSRSSAEKLLTGGGIHTAAETSPWWTAAFEPPVTVEGLRLTNRGDGWGSRSKTLRIEATFADGTKRCVYMGQSRANLSRSLAEASDAAGVAIPVPLPTSSQALATLRSDLLGGMADRIRMKQIGLQDITWTAIVPLLDVWGYRGDPDRDEWTLIAAFLLSQQQAKAGTSIKSFSLLLNTEARLQRLQRELNDLGHAMGFGSFMLTRHGVKPEGLLRREPDRFLHHMMAVIEVLMRLGRDPVLAYGTLLGAVRDKHFISHDDDVDLLYRSSCSTRAEVEAELLVVKEQLRAEGFRVVDLLPNSLNMHVISPKHGAVMDVFPCWEEDGLLQMHMEGMKVRGISPSIVYPTGSIEFLGERLPVPARPEDYLEERYGAGWRVSDQFFEWPWQLKSPDQ